MGEARADEGSYIVRKEQGGSGGTLGTKQGCYTLGSDAETVKRAKECGMKGDKRWSAQDGEKRMKLAAV